MPEQHPGVEVDGDTVRITDPRAVRLLAHEERQNVLWALYEGETLTATDAAERFGLTPSAMSYHLRQLEKFGLVRRLDSDDGRERPWSAVAKKLEVTPHAVGAASSTQRQTYMKLYLDGVRELLARAGEQPGRSRLSMASVAVTDEEREALARELSDVIARYDRLAAEDPDTPRARYDVHLGITPRGSGPGPRD